MLSNAIVQEWICDESIYQTINFLVRMILVFLHLSIIFPCILLGAYLLLFPKATHLHRLLGKIYLSLMGMTGIITLFISSQGEFKLLNHFGPLHVLSVITLYTVPTAYRAAKNKNIAAHKSAMIQLYIGGIIIAGSWAILGEGRLLNDFFFH